MRTIQKFASFCKSFSKIFEEAQKVSSDFRFLVAFWQEKRAFLVAAPTCLVDVQQCCRSIEVAHYEEVFRLCQALRSKIGWNFVRIFVSSLIQKEKIFCSSFASHFVRPGVAHFPFGFLQNVLRRAQTSLKSPSTIRETTLFRPFCLPTLHNSSDVHEERRFLPSDTPEHAAAIHAGGLQFFTFLPALRSH